MARLRMRDLFSAILRLSEPSKESKTPRNERYRTVPFNVTTLYYAGTWLSLSTQCMNGILSQLFKECITLSTVQVSYPTDKMYSLEA